MSISNDKFYKIAFKGYEEELRKLVQKYPNAEILELGGGRSPALPLESLPDTVRKYTVNDISEDELAQAPDGYERACFDVCGDVSEFEGRYDIIFSKMLAEHVPDGERMHKNVLSLLKPGGTAFHFMPTLYASPFIINRLLPDAIGQRILTALFKRQLQRRGKFPAYYSLCRGRTAYLMNRLKGVGYSNVDIRRFYGHGYYAKIPIIREIEDFLSGLAARKNWSFYSSYAYVKSGK